MLWIQPLNEKVLNMVSSIYTNKFEMKEIYKYSVFLLIIFLTPLLLTIVPLSIKHSIKAKNDRLIGSIPMMFYKKKTNGLKKQYSANVIYSEGIKMKSMNEKKSWKNF